jgi:hypothetical protein
MSSYKFSRLFFFQCSFALVVLVACPLYGGGTYETYAGGNITPNGGNHSYTEDIGTGSSTFSGNGSDYSYAASSSRLSEKGSGCEILPVTSLRFFVVTVGSVVFHPRGCLQERFHR